MWEALCPTTKQKMYVCLVLTRASSLPPRAWTTAIYWQDLLEVALSLCSLHLVTHFLPLLGSLLPNPPSPSTRPRPGAYDTCSLIGVAFPCNQPPVGPFPPGLQASPDLPWVVCSTKSQLAQPQPVNVPKPSGHLSNWRRECAWQGIPLSSQTFSHPNTSDTCLFTACWLAQWGEHCINRSFHSNCSWVPHADSSVTESHSCWRECL